MADCSISALITIRRSHDRVYRYNGNPIPRNTVFILTRGPDTRVLSLWTWASTVQVLLVTMIYQDEWLQVASYPGYFREPHWLSVWFPEITRVAVTGMRKGIKNSLSNGQNDVINFLHTRFRVSRIRAMLCWTALLATEMGPRSPVLPLPTQTYIRALTQVWKAPLFTVSGRKNPPFSTTTAAFEVRWNTPLKAKSDFIYYER